MDPAAVQGLVAAALLAVVHVEAHRLRLLDIPRSLWLSAGSGVSIAYVFVHLLPELATIQEHLSERTAGVLPWLEEHAWLLAMIGLIVFYALELLARRGSGEGRADGGSTQASEGSRDDGGDATGWVHLASYGSYNAIVGYLLVSRAREGAETVVLFTVAMAIHFVVNDHGLRSDFGRLYHDRGRWVVAAGVLVGWSVAAVAEVGEAALGMLLAVLAGGVILNVLKEELPEDRRSRLAPFVTGAAVYAVLLLAL